MDLSLDTNDWANRLNDDERHFIQMVLAFFAGKYTDDSTDSITDDLHLSPLSQRSQHRDRYKCHLNNWHTLNCLLKLTFCYVFDRCRRHRHGKSSAPILPGDATPRSAVFLRIPNSHGNRPSGKPRQAHHSRMRLHRRRRQ